MFVTNINNQKTFNFLIFKLTNRQTVKQMQIQIAFHWKQRKN